MSQDSIFSADTPEKVSEFVLNKCPSLQKTGFKVFSNAQLQLLSLLANEDANNEASKLFKSLLGHKSTNTGGRDSEVSGLTFNFYKCGCLIKFTLSINGYDHESQLQISGDDLIRVGNLWQGIENLEIWYQTKNGSAIWSNTLKWLLDIEEDLQDDDHLVPVTLDWLKEVNPKKRREFLEKHEEETHFNLNWRTILELDQDDDYNLLKYGETGFRLQVMLEAEKGNPDAINAWNAIKKKLLQ
jgi:hypothetical protein